MGVVSCVVRKSEPEKLFYEIGEELDVTGLSVEVSYSNYEHTTLVEDFEGIEFRYSTEIAGKKVVTFSVAGKELSFEISVMGDVLMLGDADGNGEITTGDTTAILQYIAGYDVEISLADADINGDGVVDVGDVVLLVQHIDGYDVKEFR